MCIVFESECLIDLFQTLGGHVLIKSPKCHPELAGVGIEYAWGLSKMKFKREVNDLQPKHLEEIIKTALSDRYISVTQVHKFSRRTRDYRRIYQAMRDDTSYDFDSTSLAMIELMRKQYKTHRNIAEIESEYIKQELKMAEDPNLSKSKH